MSGADGAATVVIGSTSTRIWGARHLGQNGRPLSTSAPHCSQVWSTVDKLAQPAEESNSRAAYLPSVLSQFAEARERLTAVLRSSPMPDSTVEERPFRAACDLSTGAFRRGGRARFWVAQRVTRCDKAST